MKELNEVGGSKCARESVKRIAGKAQKKESELNKERLDKEIC